MNNRKSIEILLDDDWEGVKRLTSEVRQLEQEHQKALDTIEVLRKMVNGLVEAKGE